MNTPVKHALNIEDRALAIVALRACIIMGKERTPPLDELTILEMTALADKLDPDGRFNWAVHLAVKERA